MANTFDQFDTSMPAAPITTSTAGNPFDKFDPPSFQRPGQKLLENLPYIGPAIGALNAATTKSQDWFAPTMFLNSIKSPLLDWSGIANKDIKAAESAEAEKNHPIASAVGAVGGALMNLPPDTAMPVNPLTMPFARIATAGIGGALGGASQGNTAAERAENALYGGGTGLTLGAGGEALRYAAPLAKPAMHALQGVSLPAYLALEHYADWFKENVMRHAPLASLGLAGLLGAPYLGPRAGQWMAPNVSGAQAPQ